LETERIKGSSPWCLWWWWWWLYFCDFSGWGGRGSWEAYCNAESVVSLGSWFDPITTSVVPCCQAIRLFLANRVMSALYWSLLLRVAIRALIGHFLCC
jgi:hypothetical protein